MDKLDELLQKKLPAIPDEIKSVMDKGQITLLPFEKKNEILSSKNMDKEVGYRQFADGSYLVSMYCPMPGITIDMIKWWFWWHPQEKKRYQIWFPGAHCDIHYARKDRAYFQQEKMPAFVPNTQCPKEKIGGVNMPLRIDFLEPEQFGFSENEMRDNQVPWIVCGHVGAFQGLIWHTEMAHIFKQTQDGLFMVSRFWLGKTMSPWLRKKMVDEAMARGMAEHCAVEYRNLAEILPALYAEYAL